MRRGIQAFGGAVLASAILISPSVPAGVGATETIQVVSCLSGPCEVSNWALQADGTLEDLETGVDIGDWQGRAAPPRLRFLLDSGLVYSGSGVGLDCYLGTVAGATPGVWSGCKGVCAVPDDDGDMVCNLEDICPGGDDGIDSDGDVVPDDCDVCPGGDDMIDTDGDSTPDACDTGCDGFDADADGVCDWADVCPDGDDFIDNDGDGFAEGCDCNDADATVFPGAEDICGDGFDADCSGGDDLFCAADLSITAEYRIADVAFLLDTTGSMGALVDAMAIEFAAIASELTSFIPDVTFGVAQYDDYNFPGMGTDRDRPFILVQQQTSDTVAVGTALSDRIELHSGDDLPESTFEALFQAATGNGYDQNCNGGLNPSDDVPPFIDSPDDAFAGAVPGVYDPAVVGTGDQGGFGFRNNAAPFVVYATDAELRDPLAGYSTPGGCPSDASSFAAGTAFQNLGARAIGVAVNGTPGSFMMNQMADFALATNSLADLDGDGSAEPAVVTWASASPGFRRTVVDTVLATLDAIVFDKVDVEIDSDPLGLVVAVEPAEYLEVDAGTDLDFSIEIDATLIDVDPSEPGAVAIDLRLEANDSFDLDTFQIWVVP